MKISTVTVVQIVDVTSREILGEHDGQSASVIVPRNGELLEIERVIASPRGSETVTTFGRVTDVKYRYDSNYRNLIRIYIKVND